MPDQSIVVFTAESYASGSAITWFLRQHREKIGLLVVSHPDREGALWQRVLSQWRRSGVAFVYFLFLNFSFYAIVTQAARLLPGRHDAAQRLVPMKYLCLELAIPYVECADVNSDSLYDQLVSIQPQLLLVQYFDKILHERIIAVPAQAVVNVHTALLPRYRGLFPELWALSFGESTIGATVHIINDRSIDSGPILAQRPIAISQGPSVLDASRFANLVGAQLVSDVLGTSHGAFGEATPQGNGTYFSFPERGAMYRLRRQGRRIGSVAEVVRGIWRPAWPKGLDHGAL